MEQSSSTHQTSHHYLKFQDSSQNISVQFIVHLIIILFLWALRDLLLEVVIIIIITTKQVDLPQTKSLLPYHEFSKIPDKTIIV